MWITHVGGNFRHGLLEKSLILETQGCFAEGSEKGSEDVLQCM